ncbi:hypothetical protein EMIT0324P_30187 [Pseudomonas chlororaphis]
MSWVILQVATLVKGEPDAKKTRRLSGALRILAKNLWLMLAAASAGRRGRGHANLRPFLRRVGMQRQRMELAHQLAQGRVDLLVTLDAVEPGKLLADQHGLEVGLQAAAVHVAFIQHLQMLRLQCAQCRFDTLLHGHSWLRLLLLRRCGLRLEFGGHVGQQLVDYRYRAFQLGLGHLGRLLGQLRHFFQDFLAQRRLVERHQVLELGFAEIAGVELDHIRLQLVPADGLVQGGVGLGLVGFQHGFFRLWGFGLFKALSEHLLHLHVHRSAQLVSVRQGQESFGTGVVAGGIGKHLAAGANQSNRGTDGTKTSHRVSFSSRRGITPRATILRLKNSVAQPQALWCLHLLDQMTQKGALWNPGCGSRPKLRNQTYRSEHDESNRNRQPWPG